MIALVHYQFETIHPFLDGNGRLGRLLIAFLLVEQQLLPQPLLYLSAYFEHHRSEYYDRLQAVRERGELREWLVFFLTGVAELANDAVDRADRPVYLRESYRQRLSGDRSRAVEVIDLVFQNPVLTTTRIAETLDTTLQSALTTCDDSSPPASSAKREACPVAQSGGSRPRSSTRSTPKPPRPFSDDDEALPPAPIRQISAGATLTERCRWFLSYTV